MGWSKQELITATDGKILRDGKQMDFGEIVTDSSKAEAGSVFIALKGERHDGHRFIEDAVGRGATCVILQRVPKKMRPAKRPWSKSATRCARWEILRITGAS